MSESSSEVRFRLERHLGGYGERRAEPVRGLGSLFGRR